MNTSSQTIQRQYDEIIAHHYDLDPQSVLGDSQGRAVAQIRKRDILHGGDTPLDVYDVGMGTGLFMEKLKAQANGRLRPFGLDLSAKMVDIARERLPGLEAAVGDAATLDTYFGDRRFDLISTHFITGFVPMGVLAPKIHARLKEGGCWSLVGGSKAGFPALQAEADREIVRRAFGGKKLSVDQLACNPAGAEEVAQTLAENGFEVLEAETFEPAVKFKDLDEFLAFAYHGGWLTPFVEALGLHQAGRVKRLMLNLLCFPVEDHHSIEIVLARKSTGG
jgi:SAM-dependent methyltransferase